MALTCTARGTNAPAVSSYATMTISPSANIAVGKMAVLVASYDNSGTNGADPYSSITDTDGNTWTSRVNQLQDPGAASAGSTLRIFTCAVTSQIDTTDTITITVGTNVTAYALALWEVGSAGLAAYVTGGGAVGADSTPTVTTGSVTNADMVIGGLAVENNATPTGDADSSSGTWQTAQGANTGGTSTTGQAVSTQYKVTTAVATQTYNPTIAGVTRDWAIGYIVIHETEPTIAPNTADSSSFGTATPTLEATATDSRSTNSDTYAFHVGSQSLAIWPPGEADSFVACYNSGGSDNRGAGQLFTAPSSVNLLSCTFQLQRTGSPTGNCNAVLYASSGGGSPTPTGAALATSDPVDVTTIASGGSGTIQAFTFSTPYALTASTDYFITFEYNSGGVSDYIGLGRCNVFSTRQNQCPGSGAAKTIGTWVSLAYDFAFGVYSSTSTPVSIFRRSDVDSGFANTVSGGDTDPFNQGEKVSFTIQAGDALAAGTYEWRARAATSLATTEDPWSAYTTTRTFTVTLATSKDRHIIGRGTRRGTARGIG